MGYKALYRKYRPASFDEVLGQDHIVLTLKNIVLNRKISHAYLFCGPRGVGKTSLARIFAGLLNCYHNKDVTKLCSQCNALINQNVDIIETDAASNNGVNEIRELKEKIQHSPVMGKYKIYIIDEVHMLSKSAFNALLKTLEEPPEHAIFILATTDPQKIPLTILSRVQRFNFRRIPNKILSEQIKIVLEKEQIQSDDKTISYISKLATGGMRDALSIVDQASAYGNGKIQLKELMYAFGITSNDNLIKIINWLYQGKLKEVLELFDELQNGGIDPNQFAESMLNCIKDFIIYEKTYDEKLLNLLDLEELKSLNIDYKFALSANEHLYELNKQLIFTDTPFQQIEVFLIKIANLNPTNKEMDMKKENKETKDILRQTEEIILDNNDLSGDFVDLSQELITDASNTNENNLIQTGEIDLSDEMLLFNNPKANLAKEHQKAFKCKYNDKKLINILLQSKSHLIKEYQSKLDYLLKMFKTDVYQNFIDNLRYMNLKAAGEDFMLLTSENYNSSQLNYLDENWNDSNIQELIKKFFNKNLHIIVVDNETYKNVVKQAKEIIDLGKKFKISPLGEIKIKKSKTPSQKFLDALFDEN
ncbi:DNA polymerase III subunit gamma/tau [Mycoplasmopsis hyopharyngis]|uniref:DNA polymerase III subunit gamma/tau n=1 Tax=Mycoplasmopsis hyopharyngis TaxID=29558 RepID=UPI00387378F2